MKGLNTVPIKDVNNKQQVTATFTVSASGSFLTIQIIYNSKTKHFVQSNMISLIALILHSLQIIGSVLKSVSACLGKLFFPVLKKKEAKKRRTWLPKRTILFNNNGHLQGSR